MPCHQAQTDREEESRQRFQVREKSGGERHDLPDRDRRASRSVLCRIQSVAYISSGRVQGQKSAGLAWWLRRSAGKRKDPGSVSRLGLVVKALGW